MAGQLQNVGVKVEVKPLEWAVYLQDLAEMFAPAPLPRTLGVPVLALLSTGGTFADAAAMRTALAGPSVTVQAIDCQHWPLTERPHEVRQAIERWCGALPVSGACLGPAVAR